MDYADILKSKDAKANFIKGLVRMAKADGVIDQLENQYFMSAAYSLGLDQHQISEVEHCINSNDVINVEFASPIEKVLFFRESIQLCAVDNMYDEKERAEVRAIAATMDIPEAVIRTIEDWVTEGMTWKKRGDELLIDLSESFR